MAPPERPTNRSARNIASRNADANSRGKPGVQTASVKDRRHFDHNQDDTKEDRIVRPKFTVKEIIWRNISTARLVFLGLLLIGYVLVDSLQNPEDRVLGGMSEGIGKL